MEVPLITSIRAYLETKFKCLTFLGPGLSAVSGVLLPAKSNFPVYSFVISEAGRPLGIDLGLAGGLALATPWVKNKSIIG